MGNYDTVTIAEPRKALKTEARRWRNQPGLVHGQKSRAYRHLIRSLACVRVWHESLPSSTYGPGSAAPMAKSSTEQLAPGVFVLPGMPKPPELPPELLPPPSGPLPAPKQLIRWGIAGAVALVTLIGTMLLWMSSSGEVPVPTHLVSRLPPPTVPIVMVMPQLPPGHRSTVVRATTTAGAAGYDGAMVGDPETAPAGDPAPPVGDVSLASLGAFQNRAARSRDAPAQSAAIAG